MAYSTTADAAFQVSSLKHGATTQNGGVRSTYEKIVEREEMGPVEEEITPVARPVSKIDSRVVHAVKDGTGMIAETAAAANNTTNFKAADAGAGSQILGPNVANGHVATNERNRGGFEYEQEFVLEGTALTETYTH